MNAKGKKPETKTLFESILALESIQECELFFEDLCTMSELNAMTQRISVAKMLKENMVYSDIAAKTGASSATISRVARCLNYGGGGYNTVLDRITSSSENEEK